MKKKMVVWTDKKGGGEIDEKEVLRVGLPLYKGRDKKTGLLIQIGYFIPKEHLRSRGKKIPAPKKMIV